jgi:hypothetical protein
MRLFEQAIGGRRHSLFVMITLQCGVIAIIKPTLQRLGKRGVHVVDRYGS